MRHWGAVEPSLAISPANMQAVLLAAFAGGRAPFEFAGLLRTCWQVTFAWAHSVDDVGVSLAALRTIARHHPSLGWAFVRFWAGGWIAARHMRHEEVACLLCRALGMDALQHLAECVKGCSVVVHLIAIAPSPDVGLPFAAFWCLLDGHTLLGHRADAALATSIVEWASYAARSCGAAAFFRAPVARYCELRRRYRRPL